MESSSSGLFVAACNPRLRAQHWYFVDNFIALSSGSLKARHYWSARRSHPACDFGLQSCYLGPLWRTDAETFPISATVTTPDEIEQRVKKLDVIGKRAKMQLAYDASQQLSLPVDECNQERNQSWHDNYEGRVQSESLLEAIEMNKRNNFASTARAAIHATIKAFDLVHQPLVISDGSFLGWYRQCDVISHTTDVDFITLGDHFVSQEHIKLLFVSWKSA